MDLSLLLDSLVLAVGLLSLVAIPVVLARPAEDVAVESKLERVAPLLLVIAYALSKLVPGRFVTVSPGVERTVGTLTLVLFAIGIYVIFVR